MILRKKQLAVRVGQACTAIAIAASAQVSFAQTAERITVTGSSIKRIAAEGSLPVTTLTRADIARSGATSTEDLIQMLPAMQGFTTSSMSVNGGGGGTQTASIHNIGEDYTLILLNGRRLAPQDSGSAVNLSSIPIGAIERVEILTDGASSLYGSDAIAGVINFVTRKNSKDGSVDFTYNKTDAGGGEVLSYGISKGFGDLQTDGFNVLISANHDEQDILRAKDRSFGQSGIKRFTGADGKNYAIYQLAINSAPSTITVSRQGLTPFTFSPSLVGATPSCAPSTAAVVDANNNACWFDYASTVALVPKTARDTVFGTFDFKLGNSGATLFGEALMSKFEMSGNYAPPAQVINAFQTTGTAAAIAGNALWAPTVANFVTPFLAAAGVAGTVANPITKITLNTRFSDAGGRAEKYTTEAKHWVLGVNGDFRGWDYSAAYTKSVADWKSDYDGGFMSRNAFNAIVASGNFNPLLPAGGTAAILAPALLTGQNQTSSVSELDVLNFRASGELFKLSGGSAQLGFGGDMTKQRYAVTPSAIAMGPNTLQPTFTDTPFGGAPGALPSDGTRKSHGVFAEVNLPILKTLEVTASARYDSYDAVTNSKRIIQDQNPASATVGELILVAPGEQGNAASKVTKKISFAWRPLQSMLLRGSYGTGFKAPSMANITDPLSDGGVTSGQYACPVAPPDPRATDCKGTTQYDIYAGGNPNTGAAGLRPELSTQKTVGFRIEPDQSLTFGMDYWDVKFEDQITTLPEAVVFGNPTQYNGLFHTVFDAGQGGNKLVADLVPFNLASSHYQGVDWDATYRTSTPLGKLSVNWSGTYMIKSNFQVPGLGVEDSVARFDSFDNATSRVISQVSATLMTNMWVPMSHTMTHNYRSGYLDQVVAAADSTLVEVNPNGTLGAFVGLSREVAPYWTIDWQTRAEVMKNLAVTVGIKNITDRDPPLSIRTAGGGNQVGYDGRYASVLGRQFYLTGSYKF